MFFVQTERIKSNDTEEQNEVGEHVHDEGRDQAHLVLHRKCEILSCNMTMFGGLGDAVYLCRILAYHREENERKRNGALAAVQHTELEGGDL